MRDAMRIHCGRTVTLLIMALSTVWAIVESAVAQPPEVVAVFRKNATTQRDNELLDPSVVQGMTLRINFEFPAGTAQARIDELKAHLEQSDIYSFTSDWPNADTSTAFSGDDTPFTPDGRPVVSPIPESTTPRFRVSIHGQSRGLTRGEIRVGLIPGSAATGLVMKREDGVIGEPLTIRYSAGQDWKLPLFRGKGQFGFGNGGATFDFNGSGVIGGRESTGRTTVSTLSVSAKVPIGKPRDVRGVAGAQRDASEDVVDAVEIAYNRIGYRRGGSLSRMGLKARATGSLKGLEVVGYYAPLTGWYNQSRGFYALEVEAGYRKGDAEFENLLTRAADSGSLVARLGTVVEWAPRIGGVNKNLSKGLRFFVRGRGWLDTYKDAGGSYDVRFKPFLDSELFFNFSEENRIFLRGEYGALPPDLTLRSSRLYVGVGRIF